MSDQEALEAVIAKRVSWPSLHWGDFGHRDAHAALAKAVLDSAWLAEHDRQVAEKAWDECSARWIELNPGLPVVPESGHGKPCCDGARYCDLDSSPVAEPNVVEPETIVGPALADWAARQASSRTGATDA